MTVAYLILILMILGLTLLPLLRGKHDRVAVAFFLMGLAASQWVFSILYIYLHPTALMAIRLSFIGPLLTGASVFYISLFYPRWVFSRVDRIDKWVLLPCLMIVLMPGKWIVDSMAGTQVVYGPGHSVYGLVIVSYFLLSLANFGINFYQSRGADRLRLWYLVLGIGITGLGAISTNLILPALGIGGFRFYGPFFTLVLVGSLAYAMLRHRLMDIQIVIKKGFFYVLMISSVSTVFSVLVLKTGPYLKHWFKLGHFESTILAAIVIVVVYPRLITFFDRITDRIFFRRKYDYRHTLKEFSQSLAGMVNIEEVLNALAKTVPKTMKIATAAVYLPNSDSGELVLHQSYGESLFIQRVTPIPIDSLFNNSREIVRSDWADQPDSDAQLSVIDKLFPGFQLLFRLELSHGVSGVYVLGPKLSDEIYSTEDISLLETLLPHANTAIQNALHYQELQKNIADLSALNQFALQVSQNFDLQHIFSSIREVYGSLLEIHHMRFFVSDEDQKGFWGFQVEGSRETRQFYACDLRMNRAIFHVDTPISVDQVPDIQMMINDLLEEDGMASFQREDLVVIPFLNGAKLVGIGIGVQSSPKPLRMMISSALSIEAASALDNALLYHQVLAMKNYNDDILQNMANAIVVFDNFLMVSGLNKRAEELFQVSRRELIGKSANELLVFSPHFNIIEKAKDTHKGYAVEARILRQATSIPVSISTGLLRDTNQQIAGVICIVSDLTLIKELQGQVEQANRLSSLGTMAAGIAHEIKNPLVSIKAFSQMLPSYWNDESFRDKYQTIVLPQIERINELCFSLLRLGKPQRPELGIHSLTAIVDRVTDVLESERKSRRVKWNRHFDLPDQIVCDPAQIEQVFFNLMLNAMQAMKVDGSGELVLTIAPSPGGYIKAVLQDNGEGISETGVARLFDPFYTTKKGGTGLGLSIVFKIIEEHRGKILVKSQLGVGTTFTVYLPTEKADPDYFLEA